MKKAFGSEYSVDDLPAEPEVKTSFIKVFQEAMAIGAAIALGAFIIATS